MLKNSLQKTKKLLNTKFNNLQHVIKINSGYSSKFFSLVELLELAWLTEFEKLEELFLQLSSGRTSPLDCPVLALPIKSACHLKEDFFHFVFPY